MRMDTPVANGDPTLTALLSVLGSMGSPTAGLDPVVSCRPIPRPYRARQ